MERRWFRAFALLAICGAGGYAAAPTCAKGTVASYLETSCSQGSTVYHWLSYSCTSTPASICERLGLSGSRVTVLMDPNGPSTLLITSMGAWNVSAGESVDVVIRGTIYGANGNGNWPHYKSPFGTAPPGQTGDGTSEIMTKVACGSHCLDKHQGISDVVCSASGPPANCSEQQTLAPYVGYSAFFSAATAEDPYPLTIEIKLNGGTNGTASLWALGTHLGMVRRPPAGPQ